MTGGAHGARRRAREGAPEATQRMHGRWRDRIRESAVACVPVWPLLLMALQLKRTQLDFLQADALLEAMAGRAPGRIPDEVPPLALLADAWVAGLALPALLVPLLAFVPPRRRPWWAAAAATLVLVVLFIQLKVLWEVGTFLPLAFMVRGVFESGGLAFAREYVAPGSLAKLAVLVALSWATAWACARAWAAPMARLVAAGAVAGMGALVALGAVSALDRPTGIAAIDRGVAADALRAFAGFPSVGTAREVAPGTARDVAGAIALYRQVSGAPVPNARSAHFGRARGHNVVVMILETAPEACLGLLEGDAALPAVRALTARSFVARRHYTTYPWTLRALFSIFTGWYPSSSSTQEGLRALAGEDHTFRPLPGFVRAARAAGYRTKAYLPRGSDNWGFPYSPMRSAGFDARIRHATGNLDDANQPGRLEWRRAADHELLDSLEADLRARAPGDPPFLVSYQPQVSHAPWPGIGAHPDAPAACAAGRALFRELDAQLARVRAALAAAGVADRTMLVLVGDHGFRTRQEFPWMSGVAMEEWNYRTPLVVHVPGALEATVDIPWATSHIDISPSILDLLGIEAGREAELGSPIWNPALASRTTFIWGEGFLGSDGLIDGQASAMVNFQLPGVAVNSATRTLDFDVAALLAPTPRRAAIDRRLQHMRSVREQLARAWRAERGVNVD